jgi:hypothetical protein
MRTPADIDPAEFDSLNQSFYHADPADVIESRLWMLIQYLSDEKLSTSGPPEGLVFARAEIPTAEERVHFAALESMLIEHQAAETLLRLCLAHWHSAPCPWWELTRLRQPRAFVDGVKRISNSLKSEETLSELLQIISWSGDKATMDASVTWKREDGWERHRDGLRDLIAHCCDLILNGADLYNAGKHGLAILPGEVKLKIGDGDLVAASGPALTVIERTESGGDPRWAKVTHWVKYQRSMVTSTLIASAVQSLWQCGKQRRVGGADQEKIVAFDSEMVEKARRLQSTMGVNTEVMSFVLFDVDHPMFLPFHPSVTRDA